MSDYKDLKTSVRAMRVAVGRAVDVAREVAASYSPETRDAVEAALIEYQDATVDVRSWIELADPVACKALRVMKRDKGQP